MRVIDLRDAKLLRIAMGGRAQLRRFVGLERMKVGLCSEIVNTSIQDVRGRWNQHSAYR